MKVFVSSGGLTDSVVATTSKAKALAADHAARRSPLEAALSAARQALE